MSNRRARCSSSFPLARLWDRQAMLGRSAVWSWRRWMFWFRQRNQEPLSILREPGSAELLTKQSACIICRHMPFARESKDRCCSLGVGRQYPVGVSESSAEILKHLLTASLEEGMALGVYQFFHFVKYRYVLP